VLQHGTPQNLDEIGIALDQEAARLTESWQVARAVPPGLLWRHTVDMARERALRGLKEALGEPRGTGWTELAFGEPHLSERSRSCSIAVLNSSTSSTASRYDPSS
jgi:hypothetical protein